MFRSWSGWFVGGTLAEIYEHVEGHRSESATINDLTISVPRSDTGLVRNIATELFHALIMLTKGRAQRLVLKASESEGMEPYRLFLQKYEPIPTVTTVSKLVDLLVTTFSGDLKDALTDCERRVTSWEHEANEKPSYPDQHRSCHQRPGERWVL